MSAPGSGTGAGVDGDAGAVRRRQLVLFSVIAAVVLVVLAVWLTAGGGGRARGPVGGIEAELAGPDTAEKVWTRRSEARIGTIETRLREMEGEARRLDADNKRLRQKLAADSADARSVIDRQAAVIDRLERRLNPPPATGGNPATSDGTGFFRPADTRTGTPAANPAAPPTPLIETFELNDAGPGATGPGTAGPGEAAVKPVGRWLPAGSHAEAVVLVRRRCVGRRLLPGRSAPGAVPHHRPGLDRGRKRRGHAGRCRRLHGHGRRPWRPLLGEDLRAAPDHDLRRTRFGDRDRDRRGGLRRRLRQGRGARAGGEPRGGAGREGFPRRHGLRGWARACRRPSSRRPSASGGGAAVANTGLGDIGRAGLGSGAASAGQKVADYMIRRAEQYQPVIQLRAGTRGDAGVPRGRAPRRPGGREIGRQEQPGRELR